MQASPLVLRWATLLDVPHDELFRCARLDRLELERAGGISYPQGMALWNALEVLTGDPFVGLTAGSRVGVDTMGVVGLAFATASTLGTALEGLGRVLPLVLRDADLEVRVDETGAQVRYRMASRDLGRHGIDSMFAAVASLARRCAAEVWPSEVDFETSPPSSKRPYLAVFGVEPRFRCELSRLCYDAKSLTRPFVGADPTTSDLLVSNAARLVEGAAAPDWVRRVERALLESWRAGGGSLAQVAAVLDTSPRTLQRRLSQHDETFETLRARVSQERARALLADGVAVEEVARRLGYHGRAAFDRAFVRWTGKTAAAFRADTAEG